MQCCIYIYIYIYICITAPCCSQANHPRLGTAGGKSSFKLLIFLRTGVGPAPLRANQPQTVRATPSLDIENIALRSRRHAAHSRPSLEEN